MGHRVFRRALSRKEEIVNPPSTGTFVPLIEQLQEAIRRSQEILAKPLPAPNANVMANLKSLTSNLNL
jgi:hypothetical protein